MGYAPWVLLAMIALIVFKLGLENRNKPLETDLLNDDDDDTVTEDVSEL